MTTMQCAGLVALAIIGAFVALELRAASCRSWITRSEGLAGYELYLEKGQPEFRLCEMNVEWSVFSRSP